MNPAVFNKKLNEARALLNNFDLAQAVLAYEKLTQQFPNKALIWFEYGNATAGVGDFDRTDAALNKALELEPHNWEFMLKIGHRYQGLRQPERALFWYEKAAAVDPKSINPRMAMAILFEQEHRFAESREVIASCLAIDPKDEQARYYEAFLDRRQNKLEDAERRLRDLISSDPRHQYVRYASRYELAEVLNVTERYDEAMQMLMEAKDVVRRIANCDLMFLEYDQEADKHRRLTMALPKEICRTWAKEFPERVREPRNRVAFLGGHPRSGTTLLEQILGAHPDVSALDEPRYFKTVACKLFNNSSQLSPARLNIIRRRYLEESQRECGTSLDGKVLLDKNPSPTSQLRIWLRLFPELSVIIALRDPRDVIISCFFQNLPLNPYNANFLSLERTAKHYGDIMGIWLAVRQWEGFSWIETRYEDTVADLEKEGQRVTNFLGLEWNAAQRQFHEKSSKKRMYSPTYRDASQPIYSRAVARWRAYEKHLAPILPVLEPYCRAFGYD